MAHTGMGRLNMKTFISSGNACPISRAIPGVWSHLLCAWVWESRWTLFTLEQSEKLGSPILKLTGPFGSNHQMCHGKKSTVSHCMGCQATASINIFFQGWQLMSMWLGLRTSNFFPDISTGVSPLGAAEWQKMNDYLFISSDTIRWAKVRCGQQTDKKRRGWVLSVSPF